jgi:hypothetical protein
VSELVPGGVEGLTAQMSPDGRFVAFRQGLGGPIAVAPVEGGERELIATDAMLVDWTRDGGHVLVRADSGMMLGAVPMRNGRKAGERLQLRSLPAPMARTMPNGSLLLSLNETPPATQRESWFGVLNDGDTAITWSPVSTIGTLLAPALFAWSADATKFAYVSSDIRQTMRTVRVKTLATGEDREVYRAERISGCAAAHRSDTLFCARAVDGDTEVVAVSLDSGGVEPQGRLRGTLSLDHYRSADRRWSLTGTRDEAGIRVRAGDGDWRWLVKRRVEPGLPNARLPIRFSPDGDWVVYHDHDGSGRDGLYRVATAGGEPQRLGDYPTPLPTSALTIGRDGRRFIVHAPARDPQPSRDYWVLDNFLPGGGNATSVAPQAKR